MTNPKAKVIVDQDTNVPVERKVLAAALVRMSDGVVKLLESGLRRDDLVVLIERRVSGICKRDIGLVLNALDELRRDYGKR